MRATSISPGLLDTRVLLLFIFLSGIFGLRFSCAKDEDAPKEADECEVTDDCGPDALCVNGACVEAGE